MAHSYLSTPIRQQCCLTSEHYQALNELKAMLELKFLKPDKGSGVVIMTKDEYTDKMNQILMDETKFKLDNTPDNNTLTEGLITRKLQILLLHGYILEAQYKRLKPIGTVTPKMRGSPKVHKSGVPLRPILCMQNSPYHKLARWLVDILDPIRKSLTPHCLKDSFELARILENVTLPSHKMYSIDVDSLFTNVPLHETVDFLCDYISSSNIFTPIPIEYLKELILLCTENIRFEFEGTSYRQVDGVAMGSPLGPTLADVFLAMIERQVNDNIAEFILYKRYVDDILIFTDPEQFNPF